MNERREPEPCLERNMPLKGAPTAEQQREWRQLAASRSPDQHKER